MISKKPNRKSLPIILFCALCLWITTAFGCGPKLESPPSDPGAPNLLLIVIDTLRADHLGCYGYERDTSPNIDKFADSGVLFENAYCQMPTTGPSHASLFTSKYPRSHGVLKNGWILSDTFPTLAQILKEKGYATAAIISSFAMSSKFGYSRGFDYYNEDFPEKNSTVSLRSWSGHIVKEGFDQRADIATLKATQWIKKNRNKPFFLWVHYYDPHSPYNPPKQYSSKFMKDATEPIKQGIANYDGEIRFVDEEIQKILDLIEAQQLNSNTLVVIMSDHGEGLWQHGWIEHGKFLYDEQTSVPLIMNFPGVLPEGIRLPSPVQTIDILPTILDLMEVQYRGDFSGNSLVRMIQDPGYELPNPVFLERRRYSNITGSKFAIRDADLKYIWAPEEGTEELYNLREDPTELTNIVSQHRQTADKLRDKIVEWKERERDQSHQQYIAEDTRKKLEALGYIE